MPAETAPLRRTEAKAFFANERTFLHWMSMSVTIGSIAAALLGVASHAHKNWGDQYTHATIQVRILAVIMMVMAIGIALYAAYNFQLRANMLQAKMDGPYDNRILPVILSVALIASLLVVFGGAVARINGWSA